MVKALLCKFNFVREKIHNWEWENLFSASASRRVRHRALIAQLPTSSLPSNKKLLKFSVLSKLSTTAEHTRRSPHHTCGRVPCGLIKQFVRLIRHSSSHAEKRSRTCALCFETTHRMTLSTPFSMVANKQFWLIHVLLHKQHYRPSITSHLRERVQPLKIIFAWRKSPPFVMHSQFIYSQLRGMGLTKKLIGWLATKTFLGIENIISELS